MKVEIIKNNIIHLNANSQYELCSTFIRMQEFYESPYSSIKNRYFSLDFFMDTYAKKHNSKFTYFTDWGGFNIPGNTIINFFDKFKDLREKEKYIYNNIRNFLNEYDSNFYIIGTYGKKNAHSAFKHEMAHAFYYLNIAYKKECKLIYKELSDKIKNALIEKLKKLGYDKKVFEDETQAYLSTGSIADILGKFKISEKDKNVINKYKKHFQKYYD